MGLDLKRKVNVLSPIYAELVFSKPRSGPFSFHTVLQSLRGMDEFLKAGLGN